MAFVLLVNNRNFQTRLGEDLRSILPVPSSAGNYSDTSNMFENLSQEHVQLRSKDRTYC
jgi:hypothetical protein